MDVPESERRSRKQTCRGRVLNLRVKLVFVVFFKNGGSAKLTYAHLCDASANSTWQRTISGREGFCEDQVLLASHLGVFSFDPSGVGFNTRRGGGAVDVPGLFSGNARDP